eukprot:366097-Chlamydomonas_euryale.AAC.44
MASHLSIRLPRSARRGSSSMQRVHTIFCTGPPTAFGIQALPSCLSTDKRAIQSLSIALCPAAVPCRGRLYGHHLPAK